MNNTYHIQHLKMNALASISCNTLPPTHLMPSMSSLMSKDIINQLTHLSTQQKADLLAASQENAKMFDGTLVLSTQKFIEKLTLMPNQYMLDCILFLAFIYPCSNMNWIICLSWESSPLRKKANGLLPLPHSSFPKMIVEFSGSVIFNNLMMG